jgi:CRP/FNR family transcriptional regulator
MEMLRAPSLEDVRAMPYFGSLSDTAAARFAAELSAREYRAREYVAVEGDPAPGFFYLRKGKARIFRTGTDGREQTFRLAGPGDTFGEVPIFDGAPNPASVETLEAAEALTVPTEAFVRLIEQNPRVALEVLRHFATMLRSFTALVEQLSLQTVQSRLARYLYQLAREEGVRAPGGIVVPREITLQDLASLVGSVREVVSRTLKVMEEDGLVEVRRKEIVIRDLRGLQAML